MPRIALVGDSQSEALWPRVRKAMPEMEFVLVRTQRGWSEYSYKKDGTLAEQLKVAQPDLVVYELGGNNSFLTEKSYRPNMDWLLQIARDAGAKHVLWLGPANATKEPFRSNKIWTRAYQQQALEQSQMAGVTWFDNFPFTQTGHVDGVHFNNTTYDAWAPHLVDEIRTTVSELNRVASMLTPTPVPASTHISPIYIGIGVVVTSTFVAWAISRFRKHA
jgi:hypothetical protein